MAGFWSGLAGAASKGVIGIAEGQEDLQRKMLARAATKRAQRREDESDELHRIAALASAREAGLTVTPTAGERSGDQSPTTNPVGPSVTPEAGPAAKAKPTRVGTVAGMDITIPEVFESKAIRDKKAAIAAGVDKPPQQTLHERIIELRNQGSKPEDAIRQARQEFGMSPVDQDPMGTFTKKRRIEASIPVGGGGGAGPTPEKRAQYVLRRAAVLTKPTRGKFNLMQPGVDRATAEQMAGEEYDRVHGVETGVQAPSEQVAPAAKGDITLPGDKVTQTEAGGNQTSKNATAAQQARAAVDPQYKAFLRSKGIKVK